VPAVFPDTFLSMEKIAVDKTKEILGLMDWGGGCETIQKNQSNFRRNQDKMIGNGVQLEVLI
jgi:hypothetical protein